MNNFIGRITKLNTVIVFNIFNSCWDIKFIVTSKGKLSRINNWSRISCTNRFSQTWFRSCVDDTVFDWNFEFISNICFTIINLDCWLINIKFSFIIVICDSYWLNIAFSCKFTSIKPYLVVEFLTTSKCMVIQVFSFNLTVRRIIIEKFCTLKIKFFFRNNILLWFEVWCYVIVKYCIIRSKGISTFSSIRDNCWQLITRRRLNNLNSHVNLHIIISNTWFVTFLFFNNIVKCLTNISFWIVDCLEGNFTICIILSLLKNLISFFIFQDKAKFICLQFATIKCLTKD